MSQPAPSQPAMIGVTAIKPVERHGWEAVKWFFWDPQNRAVMGRTGKSWALITIFYIIYYACLAAFWALIFYIFWLTLDTNVPKCIMDDGLIGKSPGLGLRPSQPDSRLDSSMIIFNKDSKNGTDDYPGYKLWEDSIHEFLQSHYDDAAQVDGFPAAESCTPGANKTSGKPDVCKFNTASLGNCNDRRSAYGYKKGQPCIYLKLNRIFGLINDNYQEPNETALPAELNRHIKTFPPRRLRNVRPNKDQTWVSCQGEKPADREALGPIEYFPKDRGFSSEFFPYMNQKNYQSPLVAVQFTKPKIGQLLHVECRAWARNIEYDPMKRSGMVRFELFILDDGIFELYKNQEDSPIDKPPPTTPKPKRN